MQKLVMLSDGHARTQRQTLLRTETTPTSNDDDQRNYDAT